jgi:hypothetical protein
VKLPPVGVYLGHNEDGNVKKIGLISFFLLLGLLNSCISLDPQKLYPQMVADLDPLSAGTAEAEFNRLFSGRLDKQEIEVVFYPRYNEVALNFRYQFTNYRQFWSQEGRELFISALESYKADYAARNLGRKFSKTRRAYGKFKGKLEWMYTKHSDLNVSYPTIELGYSFQGERGRESPFFTVSQSSADAASPWSQSDETRLGSVPIYLYFTREQAETLATLFAQDALLAMIAETYTDEPRDEYQEEKTEDYQEADY